MIKKDFNMNDVLKWLSAFLMLTLMLLIIAQTRHVKDTATNTNVMSFNGEGSIFAKPDIAVLNLAIISQADTPNEAEDQNSDKSNNIMKFLKEQGIDTDKDVKTTGYNGPTPLYQYPIRSTNQTEPKIYAYQVSQSLVVKIKDIDNVGIIIDGIDDNGAQVSNLGFDIDKKEELQSKARKIAIDEAKDKAKEIKEQLGIDFGKIIGFSEGSNYQPIRAYSALKSEADGFPAPPPAIPTGENEIKVNVTITYQIK
jgi:uncharacterized protein